MKYFRAGLPVVVLITIIINFFLAVHSDNSMAMTAYLTAFCGWAVIVVDELLLFRRHHMNKGAI